MWARRIARWGYAPASSMPGLFVPPGTLSFGRIW